MDNSRWFFWNGKTGVRTWLNVVLLLLALHITIEKRRIQPNLSFVFRWLLTLALTLPLPVAVSVHCDQKAFAGCHICLTELCHWRATSYCWFFMITQLFVSIFDRCIQNFRNKMTPTFFQRTMLFAGCLGFYYVYSSSHLDAKLFLKNLHIPVLKVVRDNVDASRCSKFGPAATLWTGDSEKTTRKLKSTVESAYYHSSVSRSGIVKVNTIISDNKADLVLAVHLLTNYVGLVCRIVYTITLSVSDVCEKNASVQNLLDCLNDVTKFFNYLFKAAAVLQEKQKRGIWPLTAYIMQNTL